VSIHVESLEDCGDEGFLAKTTSMIVVTVENCCAGLWFVILYFSESFILTLITALLADSIRTYMLEISSW